MKSRSLHILRRLVHRIPDLAALFAAAVGGIVIVGWLLDIESLRNLVSGQVSMKANTAAGFVACALALWLARRPGPVARATRLVSEILLCLLGALTLYQYLAATDLGIDQLIVRAPQDTLLTSHPGRMAPTSALGFLLFGLASLADHRQKQLGLRLCRLLAGLLFLIALTSLLGYAYGAPTLYLARFNVTAMAFFTAAAFALLALGLILLRPDRGLPKLLVEDSMTGAHLRALLPIVVVSPLLVGGVVAAGYGRYYEGQLAIALTALGSLVAAAIVAYASLLVLRRSEGALHIKDRALAATTNGIVITDHLAADEPIIFTNEAFSTITGFRSDEALGRNCRFLAEGIAQPSDAHSELAACIAEERDGTVEMLNRRRDGGTFWNRLNLAPVVDSDGTVTHFVGIIDDISASKDQEQQLHDALDDAENSRNLRDTFVRLISHELRTPLNAALTWIRLMELDDKPETRDKGLAVVAQSIDSQSRLIDDLVDATRFATGGVRLEAEQTDIGAVLRGTVEELRPTVEDTHELEFSMAVGSYQAQADPLRIQQILRNLVSNAVRYTPKNGRINVQLDIRDEHIRLQVADTGKGLSPDQQARIFEPFWRADPNLPGLGVGLAIVSALVAAHSGTINVRSDGAGKGACFTVLFPKDATPDSHVALTDTVSAVAGDESGTHGSDPINS